MKTETSCIFKITGWDETPYKELDNGAKLTKAKVSQAYEGELSGEGSVEFLMSYASNGKNKGQANTHKQKPTVYCHCKLLKYNKKTETIR